jgi:hypothetical protein
MKIDLKNVIAGGKMGVRALVEVTAEPKWASPRFILDGVKT